MTGGGATLSSSERDIIDVNKIWGKILGIDSLSIQDYLSLVSEIMQNELYKDEFTQFYERNKSRLELADKNLRILAIAAALHLITP